MVKKALLACTGTLLTAGVLVGQLFLIREAVVEKQWFNCNFGGDPFPFSSITELSIGPTQLRIRLSELLSFEHNQSISDLGDEEVLNRFPQNARKDIGQFVLASRAMQVLSWGAWGFGALSFAVAVLAACRELRCDLYWAMFCCFLHGAGLTGLTYVYFREVRENIVKVKLGSFLVGLLRPYVGTLGQSFFDQLGSVRCNDLETEHGVYYLGGAGIVGVLWTWVLFQFFRSRASETKYSKSVRDAPGRVQLIES